MSPMPDLASLIARLEVATGPDRELDLEIERSVHGSVPLHWRVGDSGVILDGFDDRSECVPRYTSSIDVALTLESDQYGRLELLHQASIQVGHRYNLHTDHFKDNAIFALAREICVVTLRSRAMAKK